MDTTEKQDNIDVMNTAAETEQVTVTDEESADTESGTPPSTDA